MRCPSDEIRSCLPTPSECATASSNRTSPYDHPSLPAPCQHVGWDQGFSFSPSTEVTNSKSNSGLLCLYWLRSASALAFHSLTGRPRRRGWKSIQTNNGWKLPKFGNINLQIQEVERTQTGYAQRDPRQDIIIKLLKRQRRILKASGEKWSIMYKGGGQTDRTVWTTVNISSEEKPTRHYPRPTLKEPPGAATAVPSGRPRRAACSQAVSQSSLPHKIPDLHLTSPFPNLQVLPRHFSYSVNILSFNLLFNYENSNSYSARKVIC